MSEKTSSSRVIIAQDRLPPMFPTHVQSATFWENLGRTIATFSFLEEVLGKAIFALTATRPYSDNEIDEAYRLWLPRLEKALTDTLSPLADNFAKAVREHPNSTILNASELVEDIKSVTEIRNILCHGSWRSPSLDGGSVPFFFNKKMEKCETSINVDYLEEVRRLVVRLACAVIDSVTSMGLQFPGSRGPGKPIY